MPAITKDSAIEALRAAVQTCYDIANVHDIALLKRVTKEALAATKHITDAAATQAAGVVAWAFDDGLKRLARVRDGYADSPLLVVHANPSSDGYSVPLFTHPATTAPAAVPTEPEPQDGLVNPPSRAEPASQHSASREESIGRNLLDFARRSGWKDDGEGAFEFIQRLTYAVGFEDAGGKVDTFDTKTNGRLTPAIRQFRHNDGSPGFVFAYDMAIVDREFGALAGRHSHATAWIVRRGVDGEIVHETIERKALSDDEIRKIQNYYDVEVTPLYTHPAPDLAHVELIRRLYVELFHCHQQMISTTDENDEPMWLPGVTVPAVLADAKQALELATRFRAEGGITNDSNPNFATPAAPTDAKPDELIEAANAVVERWHSRDWKQPHTADFIARLAAAVGAAKTSTAAQSVRDALEQAVDALDEAGSKLQTEDKSHDFWMGVGAMVAAGEVAIRALIQSPQTAGDSNG